MMTDDDLSSVSLAELHRRMDPGWAELLAFAAGLTDTQFNGPADAAGWTVQDHLLHLTDWENGIVAVLDRGVRYEAMGLTAEQWEPDDYDVKNEIMRQNHRRIGYTRRGTIDRLVQVHDALMERIDALNDADLVTPYRDWQPESTGTHLIIESIAGNTWGHYEEHIPWMQAIADQAPAT